MLETRLSAWNSSLLLFFMAAGFQQNQNFLAQGDQCVNFFSVPLLAEGGNPAGDLECFEAFCRGGDSLVKVALAVGRGNESRFEL